MHGQPDDPKPLEFVGRLEAIQSVDLRARVSGFLTKVNFRPGQEVKQGDVLFEIEPKIYQVALERAESEVRLAEARRQFADANLERAKQLAGTGAISREELAQFAFRTVEAKESLNTANANVTMARLNVEFATIRSPIDGLIGQERITPGNLVRADETSLAQVVRLDSIRAVFEMDEPTLLRLHRVMRAKKTKLDQFEVSLRLADGQAIAGKAKLDFIDNRVDPSTGTIRVGAVVSNPERTLLPGMYAKVLLRLDPGEAKKR